MDATREVPPDRRLDYGELIDYLAGLEGTVRVVQVQPADPRGGAAGHAVRRGRRVDDERVRAGRGLTRTWQRRGHPGRRFAAVVWVEHDSFDGAALFADGEIAMLVIERQDGLRITIASVLLLDEAGATDD